MSALPDQRPQLPPPIAAYIYSHDEVRRLLDAAAALQNTWSPLQSYTYRILLLLLYATGLRVSEALALNCDNLISDDRLLLIRQTKFYKSRWVGSPPGRRISPHTLRHTTAVHLLRAGVDINTIRAWLGHVSLDTTNIYAEVDLEMKARALTAVQLGDELRPRRHRPPALLDFLHHL